MAKEPELENVKVDKWQISVETAPERRDLPQQKIKLEIANIPAYTRELVPLKSNYDFLRGYDLVLVNTESLNEVMADKVVAFPASIKPIRHRDIWDLAWLTQQGATLNPEMVMSKVRDYSIENYKALLNDAIIRLPEVVKSKPFKDQMQRFIDADTVAKTLDEDNFLDYLIATVGNIFDAMKQHLSGEDIKAQPKFRM